MRMVDDYGTFEEAVAKAGSRARELAYLLRKLVAEVMPTVVEVPWPKMRMASPCLVFAFPNPLKTQVENSISHYTTVELNPLRVGRVGGRP